MAGALGAAAMVIAGALLTGIAPAGAAPAGDPPPDACNAEVRPSGSMVTHLVPGGPLLDDGAPAFRPGACVYLPPGYGTDGLRYPVLYLLHGGGGDQDDWVTQGDLAAIADASYAADPANAVIVVTPQAVDGHWHDFEDGSVRNEAYVLDHLLPYIDDQLATVATRQGRAIVGLSNGGYGAMHLAAKGPDRFVAAGAMSGNLSALSFTGLGTPVVDGGPALQEAGAWYYGSLPRVLAPNLGPLDLILDWGATCSGDLGEDACLTFAFEQAFADGNRSFRAALEEAGHAGVVDYREAEGAHAWRWWSAWLRDRHLPFVLERLADPVSAAAEPPTDAVPDRFSFRSIRPSFGTFGYRVAVQRDVLEFLDLLDVTSDGFTLVGSGDATVTTAPRYVPGRSYRLTGAIEPVAVADERGRLTIAVDLGQSHTLEQYSLAARLVQGSPGYFTTRAVTIAPLTVDDGPITSPRSPGPGTRPPALSPSPSVAGDVAGLRALPATGAPAPMDWPLLMVVGAVVGLRVQRRVASR